MENIEIRRFEPADRDWLVAEHRDHYARAEGFDDSFGVLVGEIIDAFIAEHDPAREAGWIAHRGEARLGCIFCVRLDEETAKLRLFYVVHQARGRGVAQALLDQCLTFARGAGYRDMTLWTHESHRAACALYAKAGFTLMRSEPVHSFGVDLVEQSWEIRW